eukprot:snap_masked-scaffold_3-processed-gene-18.32-mRNA-1 protein AED:1.00 eAED:1.00 QI:0/-1/0/0/-1/1/1/0/116
MNYPKSRKEVRKSFFPMRGMKQGTSLEYHLSAIRYKKSMENLRSEENECFYYNFSTNNKIITLSASTRVTLDMKHENISPHLKLTIDKAIKKMYLNYSYNNNQKLQYIMEKSLEMQ